MTKKTFAHGGQKGETLHLIQAVPAFFAIGRIVIVLIEKTFRTYLRISAARAFQHFRGDNSRRNSNDGIAYNHHQAGQELTSGCLRRNITVANGRQGYNGPINTGRYTGETIFRTFNQVHQRPDNQYQVNYKKQKYKDFFPAIPNRDGQA